MTPPRSERRSLDISQAMVVRHTSLLAFAAIAAAAVALLGARSRRGAPAGTPLAVASAGVRTRELHVPRTRGDIVLDGDTADPGWSGAIARTAAFVDRDDNPSRPYSDARLVWGSGQLYLI